MDRFLKKGILESIFEVWCGDEGGEDEGVLGELYEDVGVDGGDEVVEFESDEEVNEVSRPVPERTGPSFLCISPKNFSVSFSADS